MTPTTQTDSPEAAATPMIFSHVAIDEPATRATSSERANRAHPVRFAAPTNRPRR